MNEIHTHDPQPKEKKVLVAKYRAEDGEMKYASTTAQDILKQWVCSCGQTQTYDLTRRKR